MVFLIQKIVIKRRSIMREIDKKEMMSVEGGTSFSASMLNAIYRTIEVIYSVGESLGSFIRRVTEKKMCDI